MGLASTPAPHLYPLKHKASHTKGIFVCIHANHPNICIGISRAEVIAQSLWSATTSLAINFVSFPAICQTSICIKTSLAVQNVPSPIT